MARSIRKRPYVNPSLLKKVDKNNKHELNVLENDSAFSDDESIDNISVLRFSLCNKT